MIESNAVNIDRSRIILKPNVVVGYEGQPYKIVNVLNANDIVISSLDSVRSLQVNARSLTIFNGGNTLTERLNKGDQDISNEAWQIALQRYEIIKPLIEYSTTELVENRANEYDVNRSTLWKWLKDYRENNSLMALIPKKRGWTTEKSRLSPQVSNIIKQAINDEYLNAKKPSISKTIEIVKAECSRLQLEAPHENSIRRRIEALNDYQVTKARLGSKAAIDKFKAAAGSFPNADYPLAYVQIDHTPLDIEIVDDEFREAIGKPQSLSKVWDSLGIPTNWWGHIERMLGIVNLEMHVLDGTTFSNVQQRGTYDSAKQACMTLKELEYYIVYWITKVYHQKKHSALGTSPIVKWEEGVWGTKTTAGTGLKERVSDEDTLFIDFLPEFEATIQRTGVQKDNLFYFADCLRQWVNSIDPEDNNRKRKRKFLFKRDPRDISQIWFYEPYSNTYFKVPTAKREIPPISLFEYKQVQNYLKSERQDVQNQDEIYKAILHLRDQLNQARSLTRKQRRSNQRKKENAKAITQLSEQNQSKKAVVSESLQTSDDLWSTPLTAFDDLR